MIILFQNETSLNKIKLSACDTWMCYMHGEGEKEIANQGWCTQSTVSRRKQEQ